MVLKDVIKRALIIHRLIEQKNTGTYKDLASDTGVSPRQIFNYLRALEFAVGKALEYDSERNSYVYVENGTQDNNQA